MRPSTAPSATAEAPLIPASRPVSHVMNAAMGPPIARNSSPPAKSEASSGTITTGMSEPSQRGSRGRLSQYAHRPASRPPTMPPMKPAPMKLATRPAVKPGAMPGRSASP